MNLSLLLSIAVVTSIVIITVFIATRYRTAKADRVLIITGAKVKDGMKIVRSGGVFVWPIFQHADYLSLQLHSSDVCTPEVYTSDGVPVVIEVVTQFKVQGNNEMIALAAEQFLGKGVGNIIQVVSRLFESHLRTTLTQMSVESVYRQKEEFANKVQALAEIDLKKMGLELITFTIRDIKDPTGYINALGLPRIAALKRDAEIAKAIALRDERLAKSKALEERQKAEYLMETSIAEAAKEMEVKKTAFRLEQEMKKMEAEQAIKLQEIKLLHTLREEEMTTQIMEKEKLNQLEVKELERRENHYAMLQRAGISVTDQTNDHTKSTQAPVIEHPIYSSIQNSSTVTSNNKENREKAESKQILEHTKKPSNKRGGVV
jgi:flotillin